MARHTRRTFLALAGGAGAAVASSGTVGARLGAQTNTHVTIQATNSPVAAGEYLQTSTEVWNFEWTASTVDAVLEVGDEVVDSQRLRVPARGREVAGLGYETYPVSQDVSFDITAIAGTDSHTETVEVYAGGSPSPALSVSIVGTNDPVAAGDVLTVTAAVHNSGGAHASGTARLLVGDDREEVDAESVSLPAGTSSRLSLSHETYPVRQNVSFPVVVSTGDDGDRRTVHVTGTG